MEIRRKRLSLEEANQMDIVLYLSSIGLEPLKIDAEGYWYLALLQQSSTLTFRVDRSRVSWYDHVLMTGGKLVEFGTRFYQCAINEFLDVLTASVALEKALICPSAIANYRCKKAVFIKQTQLTSFGLENYLAGRRINVEIAKKYCCEAVFKLQDDVYHGIGFKNDSDGYEIRNPDFKTDCFQTDITTVLNGASVAIVFLSFTDFLTFLTLQEPGIDLKYDFVVLNSLVNFQHAFSKLDKYQSVMLYLPTNLEAQNCTAYAILHNPACSDESKLYQSYRDLNDWSQNFGKPNDQHKY